MQIEQQRISLPHGQRTAFINTVADRLGMSYTTVHRNLQRIRGNVKPCTRSVSVDPDNRLMKKIMDMKLRAEMMHLTRRVLDTKWCIRELYRLGEPGIEELVIYNNDGTPARDPEDGQIKVKVSTVNRRLQILGYYEKQPGKRIESRYANQVHMIDFSRSKYFQMFDYDAMKDDYMLTVSGKELHYKKDDTRLRTWIVQYIDDYSRLRKSKAYAETNESAFLGLDHLNYVYTGGGDHPLQYLPLMWLRCDNGSFKKAQETKNALASLDIEVPPQEPGRHGGTAKIENRMKSLWWEFEVKLAAKLGGNGSRIWLSEYNEELEQFCIQEQHKKHPHLKNMTRGEAYAQSLADRSITQRTTDQDIIRLACRVERRRVDTSLRVRIDNEFYNVPQYVDGIPTIGKNIAVHINKYGELTGKLLESMSTSSFDLEAWEPAYWGEFEQFEHTTRTKRERAIKEGRVPDVFDGSDRSITADREETEQPITYMRPSVEKAVPDSTFAGKQASTGRMLRTALDARRHIGMRVSTIGLNYADVSHYFTQAISEVPVAETELETIINKVFADYDAGTLTGS